MHITPKAVIAALLLSPVFMNTAKAQIGSGTITVNSTSIASSTYTTPPVQQGTGTTQQYTTSNNCQYITTIQSTVDLGIVTARVTVGSVAGNINGEPYVGRYYEIHPSLNANQPATITLYFSQADFDAYNTAAAAIGNSTFPSINSTASNLLITVFHGLPGSGTTGPNGTFDNNNKEVIVPNSIIWNANGWWEVTFITPGFSGFFAHTNSMGSPLDIILSDISASNEGNHNRIDWSTLTESAGDYFTLQRSKDGNQFETIGTVQAKGTAPSGYSFPDEYPYPGTSYYRLHMKNRNGSNFYSKVVSAHLRQAQGSIAVYPNPVSNTLTVKLLNHTGTAAGNLKLTDVTGRTLSETSMNATGTVSVPMEHLPQGIYFINYTDGTQNRTFKINKQ